MIILISTLLVIVGVIALLLVIALFSRKDHKVQRGIIINASLKEVFDYIKLLKNQDNFNKWANADPEMKRELKGIDGTVGFVIAWNGNKNAGEGEKEIKAVEEGKYMESEIRFVRPMKLISYTTVSTTSVSDNQTKVTWTNSGKMPYPLNIMIPMMERMLPKDMDASLIKLKGILEK